MPSENKNKGKPRMSLVIGDMPHAFMEMVKLREAGIAKGYDRMNWAESINTDDAPRFLADNLDSILRHVLELYKGEEIDDETKCHHGSSIAIRACFLMEYYFRSTSGSASEARSGLQGSGDSDRLGSQPTYPTYDTTPIECATSGSPTLREILRRGDEMPQWLLDLIELRTECGSEQMTDVDNRFIFRITPEESEFWHAVSSFQYGGTDTLPDEPKRTGMNWGIEK